MCQKSVVMRLPVKLVVGKWLCLNDHITHKKIYIKNWTVHIRRVRSVHTVVEELNK